MNRESEQRPPSGSLQSGLKPPALPKRPPPPSEKPPLPPRRPPTPPRRTDASRTRAVPQPLKISVRRVSSLDEDNTEIKRFNFGPLDVKCMPEQGKRLIVKFRKLLARGPYYGYPGTDGTYTSNFLAYLFQEHILLGLFYANPIHPFSRRERVIYFFNATAWMFLLSAALSSTPIPWYLSAFLVAVLSIPYEVMLRALVECSCCVYNKKVEAVGETLGMCIMLIFCVVSILWITLAVVILEEFQSGPTVFLETWIVSLLESYFLLVLCYALKVAVLQHRTKRWFKNYVKKYFPNHKFTNFGEIAECIHPTWAQCDKDKKIAAAWQRIFAPAWKDSEPGCWKAGIL